MDREDEYNANMFGRPPKQITRTLDLIEDAAVNEMSDIDLYNFLIEIAPEPQPNETGPRDTVVLRDIINTERNNLRILNDVYRMLTNEELNVTARPFEEPADYLTGIREALFGETRSVSLNQQIYNNLREREPRDMILNIISNEMINADKLNYLYAKNALNF